MRHGDLCDPARPLRSLQGLDDSEFFLAATVLIHACEQSEGRKKYDLAVKTLDRPAVRDRLVQENPTFFRSARIESLLHKTQVSVTSVFAHRVLTQVESPDMASRPDAETAHSVLSTLTALKNAGVLLTQEVRLELASSKTCLMLDAVAHLEGPVYIQQTRNAQGQTLLHRASLRALSGDGDKVIARLLALGCSIEAQDKNAQTALSSAALRLNAPAVCELLRGHRHTARAVECALGALSDAQSGHGHSDVAALLQAELAWLAIDAMLGGQPTDFKPSSPG